MKKIILTLSLLIFWSNVAFGAVTASVSGQNIAIGQSFTYIISSDDQAQENPDLTVLNGLFDVVSQSVSKKHYILNGKSSGETIWRFGLVSKKSGNVVIPSIPLGREKTNPVSIFVSDDASSYSPQNEPQVLTQTPSPLYTLSAELQNTPSHPFIQQQLTYIVTLTDGGGLEGDAPYFEPSDDFIVQSLGEPSVLNSSDGKRLISFPFALFAQKSGILKLPDVKFDGVSYQTPDNTNFFEAGFFQIRLPSIFGIQTPVNLTFESPTIEIKPVPSNYTGSWWLPSQKVTLTSNFKDIPQILTVGTHLMREIVLRVEGLTDTQLPEFSFPLNEDFRIYPEKPIGKTILQGQKIIAEQKAFVTYIPQKSGTLTLPEISVVWYNTNTQQLEKSVLESIKIEVLPTQKTSFENKEKTKKTVSNTTSETLSSNPLYFYTGIILAFVCGILLAFFVLKIKTPNPVNSETKQILPKNEEKNGLKLLRDDVISTVQKAYPTHLITNLRDVAELLGDETLKKETAVFLEALYAPQKATDFNPKKFFKIFQRALKAKQKDIKKTTPIPPLY